MYPAVFGLAVPYVEEAIITNFLQNADEFNFCHVIVKLEFPI